MNSQSLGALLILCGLGMLWLIWAERSPLKTVGLWGDIKTPVLEAEKKGE